MKEGGKCEERRYLCNCGADSSCVDAMVSIFGSLSVLEGEVGPERAGQFRDACAHFDKFVTAFCERQEGGEGRRESGI
jgi:hypothetical protein